MCLVVEVKGSCPQAMTGPHLPSDKQEVSLQPCADEQPWRGGGSGASLLGHLVSGAECPPVPSEGQRLGLLSLGRPRGTGWGGRWEGGFGMGNTCKSMADSCQWMAETTTIL